MTQTQRCIVQEDSLANRKPSSQYWSGEGLGEYGVGHCCGFGSGMGHTLGYSVGRICAEGDGSGAGNTRRGMWCASGDCHYADGCGDETGVGAGCGYADGAGTGQGAWDGFPLGCCEGAKVSHARK